MYAEVEEKDEEREDKRAVSLQPAYTQEPKTFVRQISGL
jgi:hypothetical protein